MPFQWDFRVNFPTSRIWASLEICFSQQDVVKLIILKRPYTCLLTLLGYMLWLREYAQASLVIDRWHSHLVAQLLTSHGQEAIPEDLGPGQPSSQLAEPWASLIKIKQAWPMWAELPRWPTDASRVIMHIYCFDTDVGGGLLHKLPDIDLYFFPNTALPFTDE